MLPRIHGSELPAHRGRTHAPRRAGVSGHACQQPPRHYTNSPSNTGFYRRNSNTGGLIAGLGSGSLGSQGGNRRLHRFIAIQDPITIKLIRAVSPGIHGHPTALVVICIDWAKVARLGCKAHHPGVYIDVGTAAENTLLAAHSLGLGAGPMTSFSREGVRVILRLPDWLSPELMICLGYPDTPRSSPRRPAKPTRLEDLVCLERFSPVEN